ncbi:acetyl-CoA carboxylase biotin carboxyl carrier protein [Oceanobacillus chungangensis]|uniref:Biotin carboxyl carrier protein of acetyl-CoA carboxylase n=1 Tax=Oceanobacillus chungangensis TaxID=1229152 RepID=A0A3D8Q1Q1_9BACI|nr:acetyl-CoA carboxylase biotin carboxyl carrier protein [Oceanobacillus chungangensis]RDW21962.1 acetyl-CoA carboxylase biotin carboxyl carrier protein [Oceanobacillus chungangensis]
MLKVEEIRELINLVDQSSISEFTYEAEGTTITIKKESDKQAIVSGLVSNVPAPVKQESVRVEAPVQEINEEPVNVAATDNTAKANYDYEIVSPMVGTFYAKASPESEKFVSQGSSVDNDTVVCIVEAMKLFNEIEAEVKGEIVEILVEDGELVEYGQPLFRVKSK